MKKTLLLGLLCALFLFSPSHLLAGEKINVVMILKALDSEFWTTIRNGAEDAAKANPQVDLKVLAPEREIYVEQQVRIVDDAIASGANIIILAPSGSKELQPAMESIVKANIPLVLIDTNSDFPGKATFVGTNNVIGGNLAGEYIAKRLNGKGNVALITGIMGHSTAMERDKGVREALEKYPNIKIVTTLTANWERAQAMTVMENILNTNTDVDAVFCANDSMALGALQAVQVGKSKALVVGFDATTEAVESVRDDGLAATIAQNAYNMGKLGVESALKAYKGEKLPAHIDTGTELVTKDNANQFLK